MDLHDPNGFVLMLSGKRKIDKQKCKMVYSKMDEHCSFNTIYIPQHSFSLTKHQHVPVSGQCQSQTLKATANIIIRGIVFYLELLNECICIGNLLSVSLESVKPQVWWFSILKQTLQKIIESLFFSSKLYKINSPTISYSMYRNARFL